MLLIIEKSKRANPPCGNLCFSYRENCFPPPNCVRHAAEMKAELRDKDIKGAHEDRATQSMTCWISSVVLLESTPIQMVSWQEVTRYERRVIRECLTLTLGVTKPADILPTCCWHILSVVSNLLRCNVCLRGRITARADKETRGVILFPFCFLSVSWLWSWLWFKWLAGSRLRSLDWRLSHDEAGLKRSQSSSSSSKSKSEVFT